MQGAPLLLTLTAVAGLGAAAQAPLPEPEAFFSAVRSRLIASRTEERALAYTERGTELKLNPFGRMGTEAVFVAEVFPHPRPALTYRRIIERGGRRLGAEDIAEQDAAYLSRLRDWREMLARESAAERTARLDEEARKRAEEVEMEREVLGAFTFEIVGREQWQGQPAIVVRFAPHGRARPRSRQGRAAVRFAGQAWVHEFEHEVMRVEATALHDVSVGYGMVGRLHRGARVENTRRKINGLWLTTETRFTGTARALMVRKMTLNYYRQYFNYRRFDPAALEAALSAGAQAGPPRQ
jgi:hypothetical protein